MPNPPSVWEGVLRRLETELPDFALEAWIRPLAADEVEGSLRLYAPSAFHKARVESHYVALIADCAASQTGASTTVQVEIATPASSPSERRAPPAVAAPSAPPRTLAAARPAEAPARARTLPYSFDSFVVGPQNALAREASVALARGRSIGLSPLYLAASTGLGKSHLAHSVLREARSSGSKAVYTSAEAFTTELIGSIRSRQTSSFKRRYREQCELLVIEDVQFVGGKASTQLELFHTLEHLRGVGAKVVLTADRLPREIPDLDPRLSSQMSAGLVAEIEPPDAPLRREILRERAANGGVRLPEACVDRLVEAIRGSVRDLEGVLIQLVASASLLKRPIDLELTEAALKKVAPPGRPGARLDPDAVIETVTHFFGIRREALRSRSRKRSVLVPRQLAMYLCRRYTNATLPEIGHALGRDHPAVRNAIDVVERAILERAPLRYQVEELATRLDALK